MNQGDGRGITRSLVTEERSGVDLIDDQIEAAPTCALVPAPRGRRRRPDVPLPPLMISTLSTITRLGSPGMADANCVIVCPALAQRFRSSWVYTSAPPLAGWVLSRQLQSNSRIKSPTSVVHCRVRISLCRLLKQANWWAP